MAGYKAVRHCPSTALLPAVPGLCYVKAGKALQLQTDWFPFTQRTPDTAQIVHLNTCLSMLLLFPQRRDALRGRSKSLLSQWATSQHCSWGWSTHLTQRAPPGTHIFLSSWTRAVCRHWGWHVGMHRSRDTATILSLEMLGRPWLCDPHSVALPTALGATQSFKWVPHGWWD